MPGWVNSGFAEYAKRMPREMPIELIELKPEARLAGRATTSLLAGEAARIDRALGTVSRIVVLDERGSDVNTKALAARLEAWRAEGGDTALLIGGPDGLAEELKQKASETWRLSSLTLPHGLARVVLAEALYRAASLLSGHPYHRA